MLRIVISLIFIVSVARGAEPPPPDNHGPVKLLAASWLGGSADDRITAVAIAADGFILLGGNCAPYECD